MPVYQWVGTNRKNETRKGQMEAANEAIVRSNLMRLKITPSQIKKNPKDLFEMFPGFSPKSRKRTSFFLPGNFPQ